MGMYTEFCFNAELRRDVPDYVVAALQRLASIEDLPDPDDGGDPLLRRLLDCQRWDALFVCDSAYFPHSTSYAVFKDDIAGRWFVNVHSNLKNYDSEIEKFLDFIRPHVDECADFLGYHRYEEAESPTLIFRDDRLARLDTKGGEG